VDPGKEIVFFDRYTQEFVTEKIYGEGPLRWTYETRLGRIALETAIRQPWFSALYGKWADCGCSAREVQSFLERFPLDTNEFAESPESFRTFNDFFSRKLKSSARPIDDDEKSVIFPSDGRHLFLSDLSQVETIYAKGQRFPLSQLLEDEELVARYEDGSALLSRLCPTDYHRFHFPLAGTPGMTRKINGPLYSVNPVALRRQLRYACENKRQVTEVSDSPAGRYLFLEIGATNVGTIVLTSEPEIAVEKGAEKGFFRFGGSMVITLFEKGTILPEDDLATHSASGIEIYARMGDRMGSLK
jgi:phosphatidylserine decarboxylase